MLSEGTARTLFLLAVAGFTLTLGYAWLVLPERVPVHFGASGDADRVVGRTRAVVEIGLVGYATALVLAGTAALAHRMPLSLFNVPHRDDHWTKPEHEPVLRSLVARDVWVLGALTMALFVAVEMITVGVADDPEPSLGWGAALVVGGYLVAVAAYLVAARHSYNPEEGR